MSELFEMMQSEPGFFDFPATGYFPSSGDFDVLGGGAGEGDAAEGEVSGLRLATESEQRMSQGNGGINSRGARGAPLPAPTLPPLPPPPVAASAPLVAPGADALSHLSRGFPAAHARGGDPLGRSGLPASLPPPVIAESLQPFDPGIEEELTEPGQPFAAIADEATIETPPETDTERELGVAGEASEPPLSPRTEAEVLAAAQEYGFAEGEDTEVTEGHGAVAGLVTRARAEELPPPPSDANDTQSTEDPPAETHSAADDAEPMPSFPPESEGSTTDGEGAADSPMPSFGPEGEDSLEGAETAQDTARPASEQHGEDSPPNARMGDEAMPSFASAPSPSEVEAVAGAPMPSFSTDSFDEELPDIPDDPGYAPLPPPAVLRPLPPPPEPVQVVALEAPGGTPPSVADVTEGEAEAAVEQPPPPFEVCLASADALLGAGDYTAAAEEYQKALIHAPADQAGVVYCRLGDLSRARGDYDGAITNYEIALELLPGDRAPLAALTDLCTMQRDFHAVDGYQRRFLEAQRDASSRAEVWRALAKLWREGAEDHERTRAILGEWAVDLPSDAEPHRLLVAEYHDTREYAEAIEARRRLARLLVDPAERGRELAEAACEIGSHLGDVDFASAVALEAVQAHPSALAGLERAAEMLEQAERWQDLASLYEQASQIDDAALQLQLGPKLGAIYRDKLHAPERTITAYERVLEEDSTRVDLRRQLIDLYSTRGENELALLHCRRVLRAEPRDHALYRKAYSLFERLGELDGAWNAAMVMDVLGEADINEQVVADAHRPTGLLAAKGTVPEDFWGHGMFAPERDKELAELLASVGEVAVELRAAFLRKKKRAPKLDAAARHDPQSSTTTLAKSLLWTSKLLNVRAPQLYVLDEVPGDLYAAPVDTPSAVVSKSLARGLSLSQLAFLWGRQLTAFRPEHYLAVFFPKVDDLALLVNAALLAGECPALSGTPSSEVKKLAKDLKKKLHPGSYGRLCTACSTFQPGDLMGRVAHWLRTVELAGGRAGLLACGDVSIAAELVREHPVKGQVSEEDQVFDLMSFAVSDEYAQLRARLGVAIA